MSISSKNQKTNENALSGDSRNEKEQLNKLLSLYLEGSPMYRTDRKINEVEIRFGTNTYLSNPISKIDYDNVVKHLYSLGFICYNTKGLMMLRIQNEYNDLHTGHTKISQLRAEIVGMNLIQEYCRTNNLQKLLDLPSTISGNSSKIKFTMKSQPKYKNGDSVFPVNFNDFNFRVSYQLEEDFSTSSDIARNTISKWTDQKKLFRYINRVRFSHPTYPVFADISILKSNRTTRNNKTGKKIPVPQYTIQDAFVFENPETYEIEMELDNTRIGTGTDYDTVDKLHNLIKKCVRFILSALQGSNYPISYVERKEILEEYWKTIHQKHDEKTKVNDGQHPPSIRVTNKDFIGPKSYTLQLENIVEKSPSTPVLRTFEDVPIVSRTTKNEELLKYPEMEQPKVQTTNVPNIRNNYTVTDKADGYRKLLYVNKQGKIYTIDTNMSVVFTGMKTKNSECFYSILDGEHITVDNKNNKLNLFAAFDLYFINKKSVRELAFMKIEGEEDIHDDKFRLLLMQKFILSLNMQLVTNTSFSSSKEEQFTVKSKEFYTSTPDIPIFRSCSIILANINDGIYQYNTDGLIFTPCNTGVASNRVGIAGPLMGVTWDLSFKWKPPQYNTIDFLVSIKKDKNGRDEIYNIFQEGTQTASETKIVQYKKLVLMCGFDVKKHAFLNAFQTILDGNLENILSKQILNNSQDYQPRPFYPTHPYDDTAKFCNIIPIENMNGELVLKTEDGDYFEEDTIVEFKYDITKEKGWRWIPIKVRYDKTTELRNGIKNYGNAYHVANSNWTSIHFPVTDTIISTGIVSTDVLDISMEADEGVYYNRTERNSANPDMNKPGSSTVFMRNFHNLFVKRKLILGVADRGSILIDYAVGKAGDLSKWIDGNYKFIFGIDISRDNIHNFLDGACVRYLKEYQKYSKNIPAALFVNGNSSLSIRNKGDAFATDKDKMIAKAVFGNGPKDSSYLGKGVYDNYGIASGGFNVSSCQFALHYFFENMTTLHGFLGNLSDCTKVGGYFIGTCFDGKTVFDRMNRRKKGEPYTIFSQNGQKICEITKEYDSTGFPDDELSVGYAIHVYQESIQKVIREYLVNFSFLKRMMEDYGFVLATDEEIVKMDLPYSTGLFDELFRHMEYEIQRNRYHKYGNAFKMSPEEKTLSFMNRYFIFKKVRPVDTGKVAKNMDYSAKLEEERNTEADEMLNETVKRVSHGRKGYKLKGTRFII